MNRWFVSDKVGDAFLNYLYYKRGHPRRRVYDWEREDAMRRHPSNHKRRK